MSRKSRLYIQPTVGNQRGFLARTVARLQYMGYTPTVIGYGFPPIYVNAPRISHPAIMRAVREIDPDTIFATYRHDLEGLEGLRLNTEGELESIENFSIPLPKPTTSFAA